MLKEISFETFESVETRAGTILKVKPFPEARKPSYKLWVDFGHEIGILQTSAQVTAHYKPEHLVGRQVAGVLNLGPKRIAGFTSEFLLVGFPNHEGVVSILSVEPRVPNGAKLF